MKKQLLKGIAVLLCLAFLVAPAMARDNADHVYVAPNAIGDLLVYPVYFAGEGLETNFAVINTSTVFSVVAKVVVRSHKYSQELLDFLIFLSPSDEYKGTLKYQGGKYVLTSTDDSMCSCNDGSCASVAVPKTYILAVPCDGVVDSASYGYIEVIEACAFAELTEEDDGTVAKDTIVEAYCNLTAIDDSIWPQDVLTGFGELVFPGVDYTTFMPTVFANYQNRTKLSVAVLTTIGEGANNTLCEVEAALSKNNLVMPYYSGDDGVTVPVLTFPTKLSTCPPDAVAQGPFFADVFNPVYGLYTYDMMEHKKVPETCEHSPCPEHDPSTLDEEVNIFIIDSIFAEGWARGVFGQTTICEALVQGSILTYTGAPIIANVIEITTNGLSIIPAPYDFGAVTYSPATGADAINMPCYQRCPGELNPV